MDDSGDLIFSVSDFVGLLNQTLEYAYPSLIIVGELANMRVSKGKWVYFDLKDEHSSVKFFGTVYQLPGPLEDGMMVQVRGVPRLHNLYGFSVTVQFMQPVGEGSLRKAAELLQAKLTAEGLFDPIRKRPLPYPPQRVGLLASAESAAYHDFVKILNERWAGVEVLLADVQVQGELAPGQIVAAIDYFNAHVQDIDVIVITRGGGSAEDLAAFSTEQVTRAVAGSRAPTIVAIGHEVDVSLAELAADQRASTPSNAAQLLVPDKKHVQDSLQISRIQLGHGLSQAVKLASLRVADQAKSLQIYSARVLERNAQQLRLQRQLLLALSPQAAMRRGYAIVRSESGEVISGIARLKPGETVRIVLHDGQAEARVMTILPPQSGTIDS